MRTALFLALALSLASCAGSRPNVVTKADSIDMLGPHVDSVNMLARLPAYLVPAPAGSSPRQRRQWQKAQTQNLARAGVLPVKLKNSSLATAPGAVATTITRPTAPVATGAGSAVDNTKAGQKGGAAATAPDAVASTTNPTTGLSYFWLLVPLAGLLWWQRKRLALLFL